MRVSYLLIFKKILLCWGFTFLCQAANAQKKPPVIQTKLKPTINMAVAQLYIKAPDGKPLVHQPIMLVEGGARATKLYSTTDSQGVVEFKVRNRRTYRVDFMGIAKAKGLFVPNKPYHRFKVNIHLKQINPDNLFVHFTNCGTGLPMANVQVLIQNTKKSITYRGKTNTKGIAGFKVKLNEHYRVIVDSAAYPIYPSFKVRGSALSELFTIDDLNFEKEFHYHYQTRCIPITTGRSQSSSGIRLIFKRNPQWKNSLIVFSGGWFDDHFNMYKEFSKNHTSQKQTQLVVCSHCGVCQPYDKKNFKPLIPTTKNPKIRLAGIVYGDLLSIFRGIKHNPKAEDVVLVTARNNITPQERKLFDKIKIPVKIILVNVKKIHPGYLALAKATGGSIHTIKADITQFSKMVLGQIKIINGIKYKLISPTNYQIVR